MSDDRDNRRRRADLLRLRMQPRRHTLSYRLWLNRTFRKLLAGGVILFVIWLLLLTTTLPADGRHVLLFFLLIIYLWVSEVFPLPVTALMAGTGLVLLGLRSRDDAFAPYASDAVFMILGSLIIAQGISASGAESLIIRKLLAPFTASTYRLLGGLIIVSTLMAAVIPDHSVAAIMLPIVLTVIDKTDIRDHPREMVAFTLAVAFGCSIAGLATPSGGARNVIAIGFLQQYGLQIDYLDWVVLAAPITLALMPLLFVTLILANQLRNRSLDYHLPPAEPLRDRQLLALGILGGTFLLFLTSGRTGLTLGTVAMLGAIAMHVSGVLEWDDSRRRLRWGVMFIYGAALTLGAAMVDHGVAEWLALGIFGLVEGGGELLLFSVIILLGVTLTNIMSDGAAAAVLVPITLAVGVAAELDLAVVAILTAISTAFAFMTAFGTPPNLIVHASGIPSSADFVRNGVPMVLLAVLVLLVAQRYYWPLALGWTGL